MLMSQSKNGNLSPMNIIIIYDYKHNNIFALNIIHRGFLLGELNCRMSEVL